MITDTSGNSWRVNVVGEVGTTGGIMRSNDETGFFFTGLGYVEIPVKMFELGEDSDFTFEMQITLLKRMSNRQVLFHSGVATNDACSVNYTLKYDSGHIHWCAGNTFIGGEIFDLKLYVGTSDKDHHIVVTRESGTMRLYVDGVVSEASNTLFDFSRTSTSTCENKGGRSHDPDLKCTFGASIGKNYSNNTTHTAASNWLHATVGLVRVVKDKVLYTNDFSGEPTVVDVPICDREAPPCENIMLQLHNINCSLENTAGVCHIIESNTITYVQPVDTQVQVNIQSNNSTNQTPQVMCDNNVLQLVGDGSNGSKVLKNLSSKQSDVTFHGDACNSTEQMLFNRPVLKMPGSGYSSSTGTYGNIRINNNRDFNWLWTGSVPEWTMECWVMPTQWDANNYYSFLFGAPAHTDSPGGFRVLYKSDSLLVEVMKGSSGNTVAVNSPEHFQLNTWQHFAVVFKDNIISLYLNCKRQASNKVIDYFSNHHKLNFPIAIGGGIGHRNGEGIYDMFGYIQDFRIIRGQALYTDDTYQLPQDIGSCITSGPTNSNNTLLHLQPLIGEQLVDKSLHNHMIADPKQNGCVLTRRRELFNQPTMFFPGTMPLATENVFAKIGRENFTLEFWVYPVRTDSVKEVLFDSGPVVNENKAGDSTCSTCGSRWRLEINAERKLQWIATPDSTNTHVTDVTLPTRQWSHVVLSFDHDTSRRFRLGNALPWSSENYCDNTEMLIQAIGGAVQDLGPYGRNVTKTQGQMDENDGPYSNGGSWHLSGPSGALFVDAGDFCMGSYEFTIQGWFKLENWTIGTQTMLMYHNASTAGADAQTQFSWSVRNDGRLLAYTAGHDLWASNIDWTRWHHIAYVRSQDFLMLFVDGVKQDQRQTAPGASLYNATTQIQIGGNLTGGWAHAGMKIQDIQILKNIAIYTDNFNVPTGFNTQCVVLPDDMYKLYIDGQIKASWGAYKPAYDTYCRSGRGGVYDFSDNGLNSSVRNYIGGNSAGTEKFTGYMQDIKLMTGIRTTPTKPNALLPVSNPAPTSGVRNLIRTQTAATGWGVAELGDYINPVVGKQVFRCDNYNHLIVDDASLFKGDGDFTLEFWWRDGHTTNSNTSLVTIYGDSTTWSGGVPLTFRKLINISSTGQFQFSSITNGVWDIDVVFIPTTPSLHEQWNRIALVRRNVVDWKLYLNGVPCTTQSPTQGSFDTEIPPVTQDHLTSSNQGAHINTNARYNIPGTWIGSVEQGFNKNYFQYFQDIRYSNKALYACNYKVIDELTTTATNDLALSDVGTEYINFTGDSVVNVSGDNITKLRPSDGDSFILSFEIKLLDHESANIIKTSDNLLTIQSDNGLLKFSANYSNGSQSITVQLQSGAKLDVNKSYHVAIVKKRNDHMMYLNQIIVDQHSSTAVQSAKYITSTNVKLIIGQQFVGMLKNIKWVTGWDVFLPGMSTVKLPNSVLADPIPCDGWERRSALECNNWQIVESKDYTPVNLSNTRVALTLSSGTYLGYSNHDIYLNGDLIIDYNAFRRSYSFTTLRPQGSGYTYIDTKSYDIYGSSSERTRFIDDINSTQTDDIIVITTHDEPSNGFGVIRDTLVSAFGITTSSIGYRGTYILVAIKGKRIPIYEKSGGSVNNTSATVWLT